LCLFLWVVLFTRPRCSDHARERSNARGMAAGIVVIFRRRA
jgi:hypothetical protein